MARTNKSKYAILGMLALGPKSGYDIRQQIEGNVGQFWSESYGQIYPILARLVKEGLARRREGSTGGVRVRHVYSVTPKGREALESWLREPPEPPVLRHELLLKIFFGAQAGPGAMIGHVLRYRDDADSRLRDILAIAHRLDRAPESDPNRPYWRLMVRSGELLMRMRLRWCDEALAELRRLEGGDAPEGTLPARRRRTGKRGPR